MKTSYIGIESKLSKNWLWSENTQMFLHRDSSHIISSRKPVAKISRAVTVVGNGVLAPRIAAFSSRGPSIDFPGILKVTKTMTLTWMNVLLSILHIYVNVSM